jgi:transcriptional regulator with XRE-family HTH domain
VILSEWLKYNSIYVSRFAVILGVDRGTVHRWMSGKMTPTKKMMEKIRSYTANQISTYEDLTHVKKDDKE